MPVSDLPVIQYTVIFMIVLYFHVDRTNYNLHYVKGHNGSNEASSPKCYQLKAIWEL